MNDRLPPVDPNLRAQLLRRSGGRRPSGLLADVLAELDRAEPSAISFWRAPRTIAAFASLGLVLVLAVALVALPLLGGHHNPAAANLSGYPADRALTTDELARLMAPSTVAGFDHRTLPVNTALVANVTIDAKTDVCPMNRYPTIGVIEGMGSQVCVMGAGVGAYFKEASKTGTFAFRYLAPGYLGLLAEIKPATTSRLAFGVTDSWPIDGSYIVVEGYLGTTPIACNPANSPSGGDVLDPVEYENCSWSWLSADGSPAPVLNVPTPEWPAPDSTSMPSVRPSIDTLALTGQARHVWVGGVREIDSIPTSSIHGVFVMELAAGPCPGALPIDSYACPYWSVLARVPELSLDQPATPTATAAETSPGQTSPAPSPSEPPATPVEPEPGPTQSTPGAAQPGLSGPSGRPLTVAEFQNAWAADPKHLAGRTVITKGPIPAQMGVEGKYIALDGYWAVKVGSGGKLSVIGEVALAPGGGFVWGPQSVNQSGRAGDLVLVSGWLLSVLAGRCETVDTPRPSACGPFSMISTGPTDNVEYQIGLQQDAYKQVTGIAGDYLTVPGAKPLQGIFLVRLSSGMKGELLTAFADS